MEGVRDGVSPESCRNHRKYEPVPSYQGFR